MGRWAQQKRRGGGGQPPPCILYENASFDGSSTLDVIFPVGTDIGAIVASGKQLLGRNHGALATPFDSFPPQDVFFSVVGTVDNHELFDWVDGPPAGICPTPIENVE